MRQTLTDRSHARRDLLQCLGRIGRGSEPLGRQHSPGYRSQGDPRLKVLNVHANRLEPILVQRQSNPWPAACLGAAAQFDNQVLQH